MPHRRDRVGTAAGPLGPESATVVSKLIADRHFFLGGSNSITDTESCCQKN